MAGVKISQLQDGGALQPTDAFPVARGSFTRKIAGSELLTLANFNVADSPTIDLDWNSTTRTLSADVSTAVKEASAFNVVDSPTIDLDWNASTRTLSAIATPATITQPGVAELATLAEVETGVGSNTIVTPENLYTLLRTLSTNIMNTVGKLAVIECTHSSANNSPQTGVIVTSNPQNVPLTIQSNVINLTENGNYIVEVILSEMMISVGGISHNSYALVNARIVVSEQNQTIHTVNGPTCFVGGDIGPSGSSNYTLYMKSNGKARAVTQVNVANNISKRIMTYRIVSYNTGTLNVYGLSNIYITKIN